MEKTSEFSVCNGDLYLLILNSKQYVKNKFENLNSLRNSYFYIEKWTFKGMCEIYYRAKRDKKEATCL